MGLLQHLGAFFAAHCTACGLIFDTLWAKCWNLSRPKAGNICTDTCITDVLKLSSCTVQLELPYNGCTIAWGWSRSDCCMTLVTTLSTGIAKTPRYHETQLWLSLKQSWFFCPSCLLDCCLTRGSSWTWRHVHCRMTPGRACSKRGLVRRQ